MIRVSTDFWRTGTVCPYCRSMLDDSDSVRCVRCGTRHHTTCWEENLGRCCVFLCLDADHISVPQEVRKSKWVRIAVAAYLLSNTAIHLSINSFAPLVNYLRIPDVLALLTLEGILILSGLLALTRQRIDDSPLNCFAAITLSSNTTFVLLLLLYGLFEGTQQLLALISF